MADREVPDSIDIAFGLDINEFRGARKAQLMVKDFRAAE
jgi:hypothetical protein